MSRRTNKTAHVLNLITSGTPEKNENLQQEQQEQQEQQKQIEAKEQLTQATQPQASEAAFDTLTQESAPVASPSSESVDTSSAEPGSQNSVINNAIDNSNPVDNTNIETKTDTPSSPVGQYQKFMSEKVLKKGQSSGSAPIVEILFNDHDPLSDMIRDTLEAGEMMTEAARRENKSMSEEKMNPEVNEEAVKGPSITHDAQSGKVKIRTEDGTESDDLDYKFVNVFEEIVRSKVLEAMERFDVCTCDRCIVDTVALAVTNLPAKCIVTDKDAVFPLLSFYSSKYNTQVQTELIKACVKVKENPHHKL